MTADISGADVRSTIADPARLAAVRESGLLDSDVEEAFDRLTRLAVTLLGVPAAFISLVDEHRDFYKSACGFGEPLATVRELTGPTFCHYAILSAEPLIIPNTVADPLYRTVPTVKTLGVAAYVGIPLITADGHALGSFCAIDIKPRSWTEVEIQVLTELAASAQREIELRSAARASAQLAAELEQQVEEAHALEEELEETNAELQVSIAEAELARKAADSANAAKSSFLANMSHELRTPINAMLGYTQLIEMGLAGAVTDQQREYLQRLRTSSTHLLNIVNEVLDVSKAESGRMHVTEQLLQAETAIATAISLTLPQAEAHGIQLVSSDAEVDSTAYIGDEQRVTQILVNLISNAIRFTPTGGSVSVQCDTVEHASASLHLTSRGPWARINVSDTGMGIPFNQQEEIFEPFVQAENGLTRTRSGTGLGLTISRTLARLMGGDLTLESEPGQGSTFTIWLPASRDTEDPAAGAVRAQDRIVNRSVDGLASAGRLLRKQIEPLLDAWVAELHSDSLFSDANRRTREILEDHFSTLVANLAQSLVTIERSGGLESSTIKDGGAIQRTISELHGRQRARIGWTEQQVEREYDLLSDHVRSLIRTQGGNVNVNLAAVLDVVSHLLDRAKDTSTRAYRHTRK